MANRPCCTGFNDLDLCTVYLCDKIEIGIATETGVYELYFTTGFGEFVKQISAIAGDLLILDTCGLNEQCDYILQMKSPSGVWADGCVRFSLRIKNIIQC